MFWRHALLLVGAALTLLGGGCGVDDYHFVPDEEVDGQGGRDGGPPPPATPTVCGNDADCADLAGTAVCDVRSGYCVECLPDREEELDRCAEGLYCESDQRCHLGCGSDPDCRGLMCDVASHSCTGCLGDGDCSPGTICDAGTCTPSCGDDGACPMAWSCCSGQCKNPLTDASSCGGCETACEATGQCINGACGPGPCESGLGECDMDPANGCETDLARDPTNCGRCRAFCSSGLCSGGMCSSTECPEGFADCNQDPADRCEASLSALEHCVTCGKVCSDRNGVPSCTRQGCAIACDDGFGDCDGDADTGCETDLSDTLDHCGACGAACSNDHGSTRCVAGGCQPNCGAGFDDCDGNAENGCETDLGSANRHCGACGARCNPENATGQCVAGICEPVCDDGFADCNGDVEDGCEADLGSPETCGDCSKRCSDNGGTPSCSAERACEIECDPGRGDCINGVLDGCETNTNASVLHCGECGRMCPTAVGTPACFDGVCGISTCTDPNAECDGDDATTCETDITDDPENCGACGTECYYPQAVGICVNKACRFDRCESGYANCNTDMGDGCETPLGSSANCSACGNACTNPHGMNACTGSPGSFDCTPTCSGGFIDCTNPDDGCETDANVTGVRAVSGNARVTISWSPVAGATSYVVRRSTTSGGPYTNVATGLSTTTLVNGGLTNGVTYYYVVAAVVACGTGSNSSQISATPDGQIVAHYFFDETAGTSAADSSGNGRTATLSGATWTAGRRANAVRIAGGTQRVNLPVDIVRGCTDLTVMTWVRLSTNTADWARIFDFGADVNRYMFVSPRADAQNVLRFAITTTGGGAEQRLSYAYAFPTATWKHVAVVLAGNTGRLYLDGVEVAQNTGLTLNPLDLGTTGNDWLGDSQFAVDPTLDGALDDFRISCRAYGASEIAAFAQ